MTTEKDIIEEQCICNLCKEKAKMVNWILTGRCDKCNFAYLQGIQSQKQKIIEEIEKTSKRWYNIIKKNIKDKYWQSSELNLIQQIEKELLNFLGEKEQ